MGDLADLGLFPLELVLLPGERLPLHIFEPRYRQLFADCSLEDRPFVVVRSGPAGTARVGCSARFETLVRRFADGRLNVVARGLEPVEIVEETEGRLYYSAHVRRLGDDPGPVDPAQEARLLERFRALAGLPPGARPEAPGGVPLSYAVAGAVDLAAGAKQELLESRDESVRLALVSQLLGTVERELRHARMAAERAGGNGRVTAP